jgi:hypothetical protein
MLESAPETGRGTLFGHSAPIQGFAFEIGNLTDITGSGCSSNAH